MFKRLMLQLILLLTSLVPLQFTLAADAPASSAPPRGTLYQVRYKDNAAQEHTAYLFGTIHVGKPEFYPFEAQASKALADANVLALEVDVRDAGALQNAALKFGTYPNFGTVDKHVSAKTLARTKKAVEIMGLPYDGLSHLKAWMIANQLLLSSLDKQGYHFDQGTESYLLKPENTQGKKIVGLESADYQLALFDKLSEKQQEAYLLDCLNDLESGEVAKKTEALLSAWSSADQGAFEALLKEAKEDKTVSGKFFMRELLAKRNPLMADRIAKLLKENNSTFVGIGLLHLVGPDGVPALLKKKGFEVIRLY